MGSLWLPRRSRHTNLLAAYVLYIRMLIDLKQVKCKCPTLQTEDKVTVTCLSNPFSTGSDVSRDGELIVELWRAGRLAQYCEPHLAQGGQTEAVAALVATRGEEEDSPEDQTDNLESDSAVKPHHKKKEKLRNFKCTLM